MRRLIALRTSALIRPFFVMASNTETVDITSYRRAVVDVFVSYGYKIHSKLKAIMVDFVGRAYSAKFIPSQDMGFAQSCPSRVL